MKPVDKFGPVEGFKDEEKILKDLNVEIVEIDMTKDSVFVNPVEVTGWNLANLICYHHREGLSLEDIAELCKTDIEFVEDVVIEAKDAGAYDDLADVLKTE